VLPAEVLDLVVEIDTMNSPPPVEFEVGVGAIVGVLGPFRKEMVREEVACCQRLIVHVHAMRFGSKVLRPIKRVRRSGGYRAVSESSVSANKKYRLILGVWLSDAACVGVSSGDQMGV
jgi:hypothetical protein